MRCLLLAGMVLLLWRADGIATQAVLDGVPAEGAQSRPSRIHLQLASNSDNTVDLVFPAGLRLSVADLARSRGGQSVLGIEVAPGENPNELILASADKGIIMESDRLSGFSAEIPAGRQVWFALNGEKNILAFRTVNAASEPVVLRFPDEGRAEVGNATDCRYEGYSSERYLFFADGDVSALNADGQAVSLSGYTPPMTGGALVRTTTPEGATTFTRRVPTISLGIQRWEGTTLVMTANSQVFAMADGESRTIAPAGAGAIRLTAHASRRSLEWEADRGDFRIEVASVPGWEAIVFPGNAARREGSGNRGEIVWNPEREMVDLENRSEAAGQLVKLPASSWAHVKAGAFFQYAYLGGTTFATSASGAPVTLYNEDTEATTQLALANLVFKSGLPMRPAEQAYEHAQIEVEVQWQAGSSMTVRAGTEVFRVGAGERSSLIFGPYNKFDVDYGEGGEATLSAGAGDYLVRTVSFKDWAIDLPEGQSITLSKNNAKGIFTVEADPENFVTLTVRGGEGLHPLLYPGAVVNFIARADKTMISPAEGVLVFYESAGIGGGPQQTLALVPEPRWPAKPGSTPPPFGRLNDRINPSLIFGAPLQGAIGNPRIEQPPATGF